MSWFPIETPSTVLSLQLHGSTPQEAASALIGTVLGATAGHIPALLVESLATSERTTDKLVRIFAVDPRRPVPDLIEDLLDAIEGAFQVWDEHDDTHPVVTFRTSNGQRTKRVDATTFAYLVEDAATEHKSRLKTR